jgi:hypothetical protein
MKSISAVTLTNAAKRQADGLMAFSEEDALVAAALKFARNFTYGLRNGTLVEAEKPLKAISHGTTTKQFSEWLIAETIRFPKLSSFTQWPVSAV